MRASPKFREVRQLLEELGFTFVEKPKWLAFQHPASDTLIVLRKYRANEIVSPKDLAVTGTMLDQRGLMATRAFEKALVKTPV